MKLAAIDRWFYVRLTESVGAFCLIFRSNKLFIIILIALLCACFNGNIYSTFKSIKMSNVYFKKKFKHTYFANENLFEEQMEAKLTKKIFEYLKYWWMLILSFYQKFELLLPLEYYLLVFVEPFQSKILTNSLSDIWMHLAWVKQEFCCFKLPMRSICFFKAVIKSFLCFWLIFNWFS